MKTSITIFTFLIQALFISVYAMNESPVPADSSSDIKVIILNDDSELIGNITGQTKDSIRIFTDSGKTIQIPISSINKIYDKDYYAKNNIYVDAGSVLISSYININYERLLTKVITIRVGYGFGYLIRNLADGPTTNGESLGLLLNILVPDGNSKFELGFGAVYFMENIDFKPTANEFGFAFSIGYRYQPKYGGILFRAGLSKFYPCGGFHLSLGQAF